MVKGCDKEYSIKVLGPVIDSSISNSKDYLDISQKHDKSTPGLIYGALEVADMHIKIADHYWNFLKSTWEGKNQDLEKTLRELKKEAESLAQIYGMDFSTLWESSPSEEIKEVAKAIKDKLKQHKDIVSDPVEYRARAREHFSVACTLNRQRQLELGGATEITKFSDWFLNLNIALEEYWHREKALELCKKYLGIKYDRYLEIGIESMESNLADLVKEFDREIFVPPQSKITPLARLLINEFENCKKKIGLETADLKLNVREEEYAM